MSRTMCSLHDVGIPGSRPALYMSRTHGARVCRVRTKVSWQNPRLSMSHDDATDALSHSRPTSDVG